MHHLVQQLHRSIKVKLLCTSHQRTDAQHMLSGGSCPAYIWQTRPVVSADRQAPLWLQLLLLSHLAILRPKIGHGNRSEDQAFQAKEIVVVRSMGLRGCARALGTTANAPQSCRTIDFGTTTKAPHSCTTSETRLVAYTLLSFTCNNEVAWRLVLDVEWNETHGRLQQGSSS